MIAALVRPHSQVRIFPSADADFYQPLLKSGSDEHRPLGAQILYLANAPLRKWSLWTGYFLEPVDRVARLLTLHRLAFEAERNGRERKAKFFWAEAIRELKRLSKEPRVWQALWEAHGQKVTPSADELRQLIALEVFADVHAAFASSRLDGAEVPPPSDCAFRHLNYFRQVLPLAGLTVAEQATIVAPALQVEIVALENAKVWNQAVATARSLLAMAPENTAYQSRVATALYNAAARSLSDQPKGKELAEAEQLRQGIEKLEEFRRDQPNNSLVYDLIGHLQYLRAIRLANGKKLPEALVAARKARIYSPSLEAATPLMTQLADLMKNLQTQMAQVETQLRQRPNVHLTNEGREALAQARQGFGPLEAYTKSEESAKVAAARENAQARAIWLEIGLAPAATDWSSRAASLLEAMGSIFLTQPATVEALAAAFEHVQASRTNLEGIDARAVASFIKRRRENTPQPDQDATAPAGAVSKIPILSTGERPSGRDREPFWFWLCGHQDYGARTAIFAAALALVVCTGAAAFDAYDSHVRDDAYASIVAAVAKDDDQTVIREAQRFFAAQTLRLIDPRDAQVRDLVRQAKEEPSRRARDAAYDEMEAALARGDDLAALHAAEKYAAAPPLGKKDPRSAHVRDVYAREFVRWFASLDVKANAEAVAESDAYQHVSAQLARMAGDLR